MWPHEYRSQGCCYVLSAGSTASCPSPSSRWSRSALGIGYLERFANLHVICRNVAVERVDLVISADSLYARSCMKIHKFVITIDSTATEHVTFEYLPLLTSILRFDICSCSPTSSVLIVVAEKHTNAFPLKYKTANTGKNIATSIELAKSLSYWAVIQMLVEWKIRV